MKIIKIMLIAVFAVLLVGTALAMPDAAAPAAELGFFAKIMQYLQESWKAILGTLIVLVGGFYLPGVRALLILGVKVAFTEKIGKLIFFAIAQKLVDGTKTNVDNEWLKALRKAAG